MSMKITQISLPPFFSSRPQIDCHDSGTESDGDLDTEDFHDRDIELSKWNDLDLIKVFNQFRLRGGEDNFHLSLIFVCLCQHSQ